MALVNNDQVSRRRVHAFGPHHARPIGLHRRHLHRLVWPYRIGCHDDAVSDAGGLSLFDVCLMISRVCASTSTRLPLATALRMISAAMTVLPEPVGATRQILETPAANFCRHWLITSS